MKTRLQIAGRLAAIASDDRYHAPPALVEINAPLALIQVALETEAIALAWVLDESPPKRNAKRKKS